MNLQAHDIMCRPNVMTPLLYKRTKWYYIRYRAIRCHMDVYRPISYSPGNSPGAAAPGTIILAISIHHPSLSCSQGTCRHSVFEEVHLTLSSHLQAILIAVDSSCSDIVLKQAVPVVDNSLREEVETRVTTTTFFHQFPGMSPGNRVLGASEESIPRNR